MATAKTAPRAAKSATEAFETVSLASTEAVRENFDRGVAALSEASAFGKQNVEAWLAAAAAAQKGFEALLRGGRRGEPSFEVLLAESGSFRQGGDAAVKVLADRFSRYEGSGFERLGGRLGGAGGFRSGHLGSPG